MLLQITPVNAHDVKLGLILVPRVNGHRHAQVVVEERLSIFPESHRETPKKHQTKKRKKKKTREEINEKILEKKVESMSEIRADKSVMVQRGIRERHIRNIKASQTGETHAPKQNIMKRAKREDVGAPTQHLRR